MSTTIDHERRLLRVARKEAGRVGQNEAAALWRAGFLPSLANLYDFASHGLSAYLSDLQREHTRRLNGPYHVVLSNKFAFDCVFGGTVRIPRSFGWVSASGENVTIPDQAVFYARPSTGGGGHGIIKAQRLGPDICIDGACVPVSRFIGDLRQSGRAFTLSEAVTQHSFLSGLFPGTVNTVRVLMMRDPDSGEPFIVSGVLRLGSSSSGSVDNFSRGGLSVALDASSGAILGGRTKPGARYERHPDTGASLVCGTLPFWHEVRETCTVAMQHVSDLVYVGWDVIVTETGPVILEGNSYSDVHLLQAHGPLLTNPRARRFYQAHGILDVQTTMELDSAEATGAH